MQLSFQYVILSYKCTTYVLRVPYPSMYYKSTLFFLAINLHLRFLIHACSSVGFKESAVINRKLLNNIVPM